ncbi:hypothetical protein PV379_04350 [Streptomyces caniscabiei]|uniref:hypothetical protein n=1 Tax=Streptomyces caniscabiei TaxID=2746961 RepID=UPI0029B92DC8|nr:hypothetical protein [Streptomyces caniscabiei]MDX2776568.1 hypothetical protein [Streptomyces caniscabiei]
MPELETFVKDARDKGLDDDTIRKALLTEGWDPSLVTAALTGVAVPKPATEQAAHNAHQKRPSLSPLMAAIHHILLWFFTGSSAITITGVVASLFGSSVSSEALAAMIAVTIVTFIPYAILFVLYLVKTRKTPDLIPGKVWSIITICLHSVASMAAAITLVVNAITGESMTVIISAALILLLDLIVVKTYLFAAFSSAKLHRVRTIVLYSFIPALVILFGILFSMSAFKLGPAKHDEEARKQLATSVRNIVEYTHTNNKLPAVGAVTLEQGVTYNKSSDTTYEVCASFQTTNREQSDYYYSSPSYDQTDSYVSDSSFDNDKTGYQCFTFKSDYLTNEYLRPQIRE